ncbi:hypothetical protein PIB30_033087 [Stylosanthes scabra]|uniref:Uncharacterized protein n=1 Tax=Stylosanthes scabra TaxID=79078 RepID=A0ABU6RD04_9FABA|nr:hypothetical protein [Stylosanthes scabra]
MQVKTNKALGEGSGYWWILCSWKFWNSRNIPESQRTVDDGTGNSAKDDAIAADSVSPPAIDRARDGEVDADPLEPAPTSNPWPTVTEDEVSQTGGVAIGAEDSTSVTGTTENFSGGKTAQLRSDVAWGAHRSGRSCPIVAKPQPLLAVTFPLDREDEGRTEEDRNRGTVASPPCELPRRGGSRTDGTTAQSA